MNSSFITSGPVFKIVFIDSKAILLTIFINIHTFYNIKNIVNKNRSTVDTPRLYCSVSSIFYLLLIAKLLYIFCK